MSKCSKDYHSVASNFFISSVTVWCGILLQYSVVSDFMCHFSVPHIFWIVFGIVYWNFQLCQGSATGNYFLICRAFGLMCAWLPFYHMLNDSGESVTYAFGNLNASIFCKSWYLCPVELQRYVILVMCMAQKPAYLEGFAHINFSRETFKKVSTHLDGIVYSILRAILLYFCGYRSWTLATRTLWFFVDLIEGMRLWIQFKHHGNRSMLSIEPSYTIVFIDWFFGEFSN